MFLYQILKEMLENLYYITSIGLFAGIVVASRQLKIMKADIQAKNKRASVEKSIEYLHWFATEFIPQFEDYQNKLSGKRINIYPNIKNRAFTFNSEINLKSPNVVESIKHKNNCGATTLINQLEFFSAAMMSGLADEELAFNPLADAFCRFVELNYDVYCDARNGVRETLFTHTIELYIMWKERLESLHLQKEKQVIEEKMSKIKHKSIKILGNE
ncbi:hypothetical protein ACIP9G_02110 [Lysinibacillus sp. NPDC093197]|uniref:hypothetical protein n=1 Tax=Lysinibacillus sp. NPDC093197 TaxID=3364132 RepID=UPI00382E5A36